MGGITEVKFRITDQIAAMHRIDSELRTLDYELSVSQTESDTIDLKANIAAREDILKPVYLQAATEFADLHDKTGRMKAKGVIKEAVPWADSRTYFFYLAKRRIAQDRYVAQLKAADPLLDSHDALSILSNMCTTDWDNNKAVLEYYVANHDGISSMIREMKMASFKAQIAELQKKLGE